VYKRQFKWGYATAFMHAAYDGSLATYADCPKNLRTLWYRLLNKEDHTKNFLAMEQHEVSLMIRGHDHAASLAVGDRLTGDKEAKLQCTEFHECAPGDEFLLMPNKMYTVTVGALCEDEYATIDTQAKPLYSGGTRKFPVVRFHSVDDI